MIVNDCVHAYSPGYTSMECNSVYRTMPMTDEVVDSGGYHDPSVNNSRLTLGAGTWLVFGHSHWSDPGFDISSRLLKNGVSVGYEYDTDGFAATPSQISGPLCFWLETLAAGDYLEMQTQNNRGAGNFRSARSQMVACKVSDWSVMVAGSASSTASYVTFPTVVHDPHGMASSATTVTARKAGFYLVVTVYKGLPQSFLEKNSSGGPMKGSYAEGRCAVDYAVDYFDVGEHVRMVSTGASHTYRQMAMIYLGGPTARVTYGYNSVDLDNSKPFMTPARFDSEWIDVGEGHPGGGPAIDVPSGVDTNSGKFNLLAGYHLAIGKTSSDGGTFLQNESDAVAKNGTQLGIPYANNRHQRGSKTTIVAVACFPSVQDDKASLVWMASGNYVEALYTPYSNFFVTDCAAFPYSDDVHSMFARMADHL